MCGLGELSRIVIKIIADKLGMLIHTIGTAVIYHYMLTQYISVSEIVLLCIVVLVYVIGTFSRKAHRLYGPSFIIVPVYACLPGAGNIVICSGSSYYPAF